MTKTTLPKLPSKADKKWYLVDAKNQSFGRLAAKIAVLLRGKHKAIYTPHIDMGDYVVVVNADQVRATGAKESNKEYFHHTGYPGGIKSITLGKLRQQKPTEILLKAIAGMLPRNRTRRSILSRLKIYAGDQHEHTAQKPEPITL